MIRSWGWGPQDQDECPGPLYHIRAQGEVSRPHPGPRPQTAAPGVVRDALLLLAPAAGFVAGKQPEVVRKVLSAAEVTQAHLERRCTYTAGGQSPRCCING